jgi:hypothetical protein
VSVSASSYLLLSFYFIDCHILKPYNPVLNDHYLLVQEQIISFKLINIIMFLLYIISPRFGNKTLVNLAYVILVYLFFFCNMYAYFIWIKYYGSKKNDLNKEFFHSKYRSLYLFDINIKSNFSRISGCRFISFYLIRLSSLSSFSHISGNIEVLCVLASRSQP